MRKRMPFVLCAALLLLGIPLSRMEPLPMPAFFEAASVTEELPVETGDPAPAPPVEVEPPAEEPPVEEPPVEEPPAEEPPVEEPSVEEPPAEEPPVEVEPLPEEVPYVPPTYTPTEFPNPDEGAFYFAHFDTQSGGGFLQGIPGFQLRFKGDVAAIDPDGLTDVTLTRNGQMIDNPFVFTGQRNCFVWGYEEVTDFCFTFDDANRQPGLYELTGTFNNEPFIIRATPVETPPDATQFADADALFFTTFMFFPNADGQPLRLSELCFNFEGPQQSFSPSDLDDLCLTRDGVALDLACRDDVFRYLFATPDGSYQTTFHLILEQELTVPGTYRLTGTYQGVPFPTAELTIP